MFTTYRDRERQPRVLFLRPVTEIMPWIMDARRTALARYTAGVVPSGLASAIVNAVKLDSTIEVMYKSLKQLRTDAKTASFILTQILESKNDRYVIDASTIMPYITAAIKTIDTIKDPSLSEATSPDVDQVTRLLISAITPKDRWYLMQNGFTLPTSASALYQTIASASEVSRKETKKGKQKEELEKAEAELANVLLHSTNGAFSIPARSLTQLADVRVVDILVHFKMDPSYLESVMPIASASPGRSGNVARRNMLDAIAGWAHALLMARSQFLIGLIKQSYVNVEKVLGKLPATSSRVFDHLVEYVDPYDFFNFQGEAKDCITEVERATVAYSDHTEVVLLATEIFSLLRIINDDQLDALTKSAPIDLTSGMDVALDAEYRGVSFNMPIGRNARFTTFVNALALSTAKDEIMAKLIAAATIGSGDYYSKEINQSIVRIAVKPAIALSVPMPMVHVTKKSNPSKMQAGRLISVPMAPPSSALVSETMERTDKFRWMKASQVTDKYQATMGIDYDKAGRFRKLLLMEFSSLMPSNLVPGKISYTMGSLSPDNLNVLESITGLQANVLLQFLRNPQYAKAIASIMSSWCVIKRLDSKDAETEGSELLLKFAGLGELIVGHGLPWGTRYETLEKLASQKTMIKLKEFLFIPLVTVPLPTTGLINSEFDGVDGFWYYRGESDDKSTPIKGFCVAESCLQFCSIPLSQVTAIPQSFTAGEYLYENDDMVTLLSSAPDPITDLGVEIPLETIQWLGHQDNIRAVLVILKDNRVSMSAVVNDIALDSEKLKKQIEDDLAAERASVVKMDQEKALGDVIRKLPGNDQEGGEVPTPTPAAPVKKEKTKEEEEDEDKKS